VARIFGVSCIKLCPAAPDHLLQIKQLLSPQQQQQQQQQQRSTAAASRHHHIMHQSSFKGPVLVTSQQPRNLG
jgi:hypothetical protein